MCTQLWRLSLYYDQLRDSGCNSHIYIRSFLWKIANDFLINIHHHSMREFSLCLSLFLLNILWVCNLFLPTHFQNVFYQPLCFLIDFTPAVENRDAVFCPDDQVIIRELKNYLQETYQCCFQGLQTISGFLRRDNNVIQQIPLTLKSSISQSAIIKKSKYRKNVHNLKHLKNTVWGNMLYHRQLCIDVFQTR